MRKELLLAVGVCCLIAAPLSAQRRGHFQGRSPWSSAPGRSTVFYGSAYHSLYQQPFYGNSFYGSPFYGSTFSYGLTNGGYGYAPAYYGNGNGRPSVVMYAAPEAPPERQIVYVPTYLRPDPGTPLGDLARALRAQRRTAQ